MLTIVVVRRLARRCVQSLGCRAGHRGERGSCYLSDTKVLTGCCDGQGDACTKNQLSLNRGQYEKRLMTSDCCQMEGKRRGGGSC
jgi:hypothetical protein